MSSVAAVMQQWTAKLQQESGIDKAEAQSMLRLLSAHVLNIHPRDLAFCLRDPLSEQQERRIAELAQQLLQGAPLQYLLGETEFMGLPFRCSPAALIPRIDSEVLVETAIELLQNIPAPRIADICCGSGTYGLSLAHYLPQAQVLCCDISAEALKLAEENAALLGLSERVQFRQGDLLAPLQQEEQRPQMIVSNPPYIATEELAQLDRWVQNEPQLALDGGADGLYFYRRLAADVPVLLEQGGLLLLEYGDEQREAVCALMEAAGLRTLRTVRDHGAHDRGAVFIRE